MEQTFEFRFGKCLRLAFSHLLNSCFPQIPQRVEPDEEVLKE